MSWSASKLFSAFLTDALNNTAALDLNSDTLRAALYNNNITPSQSVSSASTAYNAGVWGTGNEVIDTNGGTGWPSGGVALASSPPSGFSGNVYTFDAADVVSLTGITTLASAYGLLLYDDTIASPVASQGIGFVNFGGVQAVTIGTFQVAWDADGIIILTL